MAPTDALARQHFENAKKIFKDTKLHIALLLGSTPMSEKKRIYADLEDGTIDIVIGTHALFAKSVVYSSLGLAIIDEQHRFGVNQRLTLANKGEHADLLMMSATPIPRTLALSLYGDLDISTLTSFPSKKRDVLTKIVSSDDEEIFASVEESLKDNHQVYVVAPLIEYREDERYSVEKLYARFALKFKGKVGLLHGKMSNGEKEEALNKFYSGELPILVSTPVIEVGIDVKGANLMIIYDASNFGLASLHQLRGRIGRDGKPSKCLLTLDDEEDKEAKDRLSILARSEDGFVIAEEDMKLRGPGELAGLKQSGIPTFSFLNVVNDYKIFVVARDDAKEIMKNKNNEEYRYILSRAEKEVNINPILKG
jgi:ATP-dependent DNA helicase RecG